MRLLSIFAVGLLVGLLTAADDKKGGKRDEESIVGTWTAEKVETGDEQADKTRATDLKHTLTFNKDGKLVRLTTRADGNPLLGKEENTKPVGFRLDPSKAPKAIDVESGAKDELAGIYELDGDTLRVCLAKTAGTARPTEFKGDKDKSTLMVLKRVKDESRKDK